MTDAEHIKIVSENIARIEREFAMENRKDDICELKVEIAQLKEKNIAAADALKLAKDSVSINLMISIGTIVLSFITIVVAVVLHFLK